MTLIFKFFSKEKHQTSIVINKQSWHSRV